MNRLTLLVYGFLDLLGVGLAVALMLPRSARAVLLVAMCAFIVLTFSGCVGGGGDDPPPACRKFITLANGSVVPVDRPCPPGPPPLNCQLTPEICQ